MNGFRGDLKAGLVFEPVEIDGFELRLEALVCAQDVKADPDTLEIDVYQGRERIARYFGPLSGELSYEGADYGLLDRILDGIER